MSGARDSMTTEIRALPNGSEPAEKGLRLGLRQGRPASRRGAPRRPTSTAATGSKAPLRPEPTMTPASRHGVESAARPLRQCEKEGNGRRDAPARERAGRASNRAGRCEVSLSEHRPGGRADMIDRSQPRLLFQARSLPMRAFALPGPLSASPPSGVGWLLPAVNQHSGLRFRFASPIWRATPQADFMRLLIQGVAPVARSPRFT